MQGTESVRTVDRKKKQAEVERLHEKTFKAWCNAQLKKRNLKMEKSLQEEFQTGLMLINLVEILTKKKCSIRYHVPPETDFQKMENITIALEFTKENLGGKLNVSSTDVIKGNMKVVLGMIWRLILAYQVESGDEDEKMSAAQRTKVAKQKLLTWCQEKLHDYRGVNIQNFEDSWYDGLGFCGLVHKYDPRLLNFDALKPEDKEGNLELAFSLAEKHLGIPRLLDPEDIVAENQDSRPDEQCFITYLSEFPLAFLHKAETSVAVNKEEEERRKVEELERERKRREDEERRRKEDDEKKRREIAEAQDRARRETEDELRRKQAEDEAKRKALEMEEEERRRREQKKRDDEDRSKRDREDADRDAEEKRREEEFEDERRRLQAENEKLRRELGEAKAKLIGKLKVTVIEARQLRKKNPDPYVVLFLDRQKEKTKTVKKSHEPKWESEFEFYVSKADDALEVTLFDWNWIFHDDFLGKMEIKIADLEDGEETEHWYKLQPKKKKEKVSGEIKLKLLYRKEK